VQLVKDLHVLSAAVTHSDAMLTNARAVIVPRTDHLPVNRGFDSHVGFLSGAESYFYGNFK
jgi:hypothetical protein